MPEVLDGASGTEQDAIMERQADPILVTDHLRALVASPYARVPAAAPLAAGVRRRRGPSGWRSTRPARTVTVLLFSSAGDADPGR